VNEVAKAGKSKCNLDFRFSWIATTTIGTTEKIGGGGVFAATRGDFARLSSV
jgi:hypothetical protein